MKIRLILAFLIISVSAGAQLIHVEGSKALGINYAYVKNGFNVSSRITFYKSGNLAFKPDALKKPVDLSYIGIEIPNDFIVGYGLDYDGFGRNLIDIYKVID